MVEVAKEELLLLYCLVQRDLYPKVQYPIGKTHVDFCFPKDKVVIEIDGGYHRDEQQQRKDNDRDSFIQKVLQCRGFQQNLREKIRKNLLIELNFFLRIGEIRPPWAKPRPFLRSDILKVVT